MIENLKCDGNDDAGVPVNIYPHSHCTKLEQWDKNLLINRASVFLPFNWVPCMCM